MLVYEFVCNLICFLVLLLLVNILGHDTYIQNSHPAGGRLPLVLTIQIDLPTQEKENPLVLHLSWPLQIGGNLSTADLFNSQRRHPLRITRSFKLGNFFYR